MNTRRILRGGRGSLFLIAGLFLASALVRAGSGADQALARVGDASDGPDAAARECPPRRDPDPLLAALSKREKRLAHREGELRDRAQALEVAGREIARKMDALRAAEDRLRETLSVADGAAEGDVSQLVKVYETMKPKNAAALFEEMDPEFAAGFLGRMRAEAAAGIMADLTPQAAYTVSVVLAGRNADVPTR
jgi:flagellar motility protein MotE (MotC chaperone)